MTLTCNNTLNRISCNQFINLNFLSILTINLFKLVVFHTCPIQNHLSQLIELYETLKVYTLQNNTTKRSVVLNNQATIQRKV